MTIVSTLRPFSWFNDFEHYNIEVTAITRHWDGAPIKNTEHLLAEDKRHPKVEVVENKNVHYLPYRKSRIFKIAEYLESKKTLQPFFLLYKLALSLGGVFTNEADIHYAFKDYIDDLLKKEKFDLVITSAMPISALKLASHIKAKFGLPVIVDFRDHWNNNLLNQNFKFKMRAKFYFFIQESYIKKWLKNVDRVITVSDGIKKELSRIDPLLEKEIIFNGFESNTFPSNRPSLKNTSCFNVTILGALYPTQDIDFMLRGFNLFFKGKKSTDVKINFIGLGYFEGIAKQVIDGLPSSYIKVTDRIERGKALDIVFQSHILYYIGWKGFKGIYSGKIFEYLGARKNILVAPTDEDVLEDLLKETSAGKTAENPEEMACLLNTWFYEWKRSGEVLYYGKEVQIQAYSRENQSKRLAEYILSFLNEKK